MSDLVSRALRRLKRWSGHDRGREHPYASLSVNQIKNLMDERFRRSEAYQITCLWDRVRCEELNRHVVELIGPSAGRVLEIGCGEGGSAAYLHDCQEFVGTDLSEAAIERARSSYAAKSNFRFLQMDAMNLKFDDGCFDVVIAKEVIEHLPEPERAIREAYRVLKPNGRLVVTSPNRDSLHLRVNRLLGHQDFLCSFDHVREFTYGEAVVLLSGAGFSMESSRGVFAQPYWGIPKIDRVVRRLTDNHPEMVEMLRELGERVGPEYAFCYVILCRRP